MRRAHLRRQPSCQACGGKARLNVHHIRPFHLHRELELTRSNLITLCEGAVVNCHLLFGHLRDWKSFNTTVRADAARWLKKIAHRKRA
ncbi:MAG TPA: HNH endonuclease [Pirellulales bacterium]|nr:HNH endonuclease [Pirellulales bacterium]